MADKKSSPDEDKEQKDTAPVQAEGTGKAEVSSEAPYQLPEKFKGKSPEEITKAYIELEKKLGDQSKTVEEANKLKEQTDTLLRAIWADPDLYRSVEQGIQKYMSGGIVPETRKTDEPKKGDEELKGAEVNPQIADIKTAQENQILDAFFTKFGYKGLDEKERKESYNRLSMALVELVDPGGKKPMKQIMAEIPLSKLPRFLENAHFIANKEKVVEQAKRSALLSKEENDAGSIGSFAASTGQGASEGVKLTNQEREMAQKMGISEEAYAKRKGEILKESNRFER